MKNKKFLYVFILGLLLTSVSPYLASRFNLPDNLAGLLSGLGVGMMIAILYKMAALRRRAK